MNIKHTPGPWEITWFHCRMDADDVKHAESKGDLTAKVGDVLWSAPKSIGPCEIEHSHWGGDLLDVEEADARLIAAAPDLLEACKTLVHLRETEDWMETLHKAVNQARAAIKLVEEEKE